MDAETTGTTPPAASPPPHARVARPERVQDGGRLTSAASMRERLSTADTGTMTDADGLARELADLAQSLQASPSTEEAMHAVLTAAVRLVPGADEAAISLVRAGGRVTSAAATGPAGKRLDDLQTELGQGPCLDAVLTHRSTRVDDLFHDDRWPLLSAHAQEIGMPSMLCLQLHTDAGDLGALNLLGTRRGAFSDASEHIGLLLATHAAVAISGARELWHMVSVLASRDIIGQAKGILMERFKMSPDQAFKVLAQASQDHNRKLVDIAADLAATGALPRPPAPSRRRPHRR